jgi:hypothetical protein
MLFVAEPSIMGREPAGHRATIITHQPALTTMAAPAPSSWRTRRNLGAGAANR